MTNSFLYWQRRYKLITVLLAISPFAAYWFLELSIGTSLSSETRKSVLLITAFWSLTNLLVLIYFHKGNASIKTSLQLHTHSEHARVVAQRNLESLLNGVPYMLGYWDNTLHNRFSNKAYADWFSIDPTNLLGKHISTLMSPKRLETAMPLITKALSGERCEYLVKLNNKIGERPTHILVQYLPDITDGEVTGFYAIGQDISEKYRAEQNLTLRTKLLELASEIAHVASIIIEPVTGAVQLTPEARRLLNCEQDAFSDLDTFCAQFVCKQQQAEVAQCIHAALAQQSSLSIEFKAHDEVAYFGCSGESVMLENKPSYLICLMDITESTNAKTRLIEAREKADQLTAAKSQFVATMSHEIRNPLHTILGLCNLLDEQCDTETQKDLTDKLKLCTEDLVDLLTNSLDSFRLDRGELHFEEAEFDLWAMVGNLSNNLYGGAKNHNLELRVELKGNIQRHWVGDAFRIKQMVSNLISNACKFTESGHIHLHVEQLSENLVQFTVNDTGPCIPKESLESLFKQQEHKLPSTERLYGGSGLGLNLVKSLVERIGGAIEITSGEGNNTSATLQIPLKPSQNTDTETLKLINARGIQLAVAQPACESHAQSMLAYMGYRGTAVQGPSLLITDRVQIALAHIEFNPDHHALLLPSLSGHAQATGQASDSDRIFMVQGPLQPLVIVKWLESVQTFSANTNPLPQPVEPAAELVVLLVEDVKITRMVLKKLLSARGITCIEAENGQKAVEIIEAQGDKIDFVFMDINMPVLNGIDATIKIRSDHRYSDLRIYALTGEDEATTSHSRDWSLFDKVISKPLRMPTLDALLDNHRATKAHESYLLQ